MVTLRLKNSKYMILNNSCSMDESKKYKELLKDIIRHMLRHLDQGPTSTQSVVHVFLATLTLIVNEREVAEQEKAAIGKIIEKLLGDEYIYEDHMLLEYKSYVTFAKAFFDQDYETQNGVLYTDKRSTQQSMWVKVLIESTRS